MRQVQKGLQNMAWVMIVILIIFSLAGATQDASSADKPLQIRMVTLTPLGSSPHVQLLKMGEHWQKASEGRVRLNIIAGYRGGGEAAMVDKMRVGGVDSALMTLVGISKIDLAVNAMSNIPMVFQSLDEVDYIQESLGEELSNRLAQKGYVVLFWSDIGWCRYFSVEPLVYPDDMKRMKVFVSAGDPEQVEIMKGWGTHPVSLEPADIFPSLSTGMIGVVLATPFSANAGQYANVAKHMLEINWAPLVGGAIVRRAVWDRVPSYCRQELLNIAANAGKAIKASGRKESDEAVEAMKRKQGLKVHVPSAQVNEEWRQAARSAYPKIRGTMVPADMFDRVESLLKEYRIKHGATK